MRSPSHRFRRIFRAKSEAKAKSENRPRCRAKSESRPRWKNPDLGAGSACQAGGAAGGFYAGQLGPRSHWQKKACCSPPPTGGLEFFFLGRIPTLERARQGSDAGQARPGGYARQECGALGVGQARIGRAIKRGWGEPSNPFFSGTPFFGTPCFLFFVFS